MAEHTNSSNVTYTDFIDYSSIKEAIRVQGAITIVIAIVGTTLNLWFLAAMLSLADVRSRLRNKIICSSFVLHLISGTIILPVIGCYELISFSISCVQHSILAHLYFITELISNWQLVMLLAVFLAQIMDFDPTSKLSSGAATLGTIGLLVLPWAASLVIVPVITHEYWKYSPYQYYDCHNIHPDSMDAFRSLDTAVPIVLAIVLLIIATYFKYRRFNLRNSSQSMHVELIGRGPEIDNTCVYVLAIAVSIVCDLPQLLMTFDVSLYQTNQIVKWYITVIVANLMNDIRVILMPITWLLLPDIRQRIKTWRPWYRPAPGIDLTMTYAKETAAAESDG
ncbi:hypothetical protein BsWGS_23458 [Bradybaena similaris]